MTSDPEAMGMQESVSCLPTIHYLTVESCRTTRRAEKITEHVLKSGRTCSPELWKQVKRLNHLPATGLRVTDSDPRTVRRLKGSPACSPHSSEDSTRCRCPNLRAGD